MASSHTAPIHTQLRTMWIKPMQCSEKPLVTRIGDSDVTLEGWRQLLLHQNTGFQHSFQIILKFFGFFSVRKQILQSSSIDVRQGSPTFPSLWPGGGTERGWFCALTRHFHSPVLNVQGLVVGHGVWVGDP